MAPAEVPAGPSSPAKRNYTTFVSDVTGDTFYPDEVIESSKPKSEHEYRFQQAMLQSEISRLTQGIEPIEKELDFWLDWAEQKVEMSKEGSSRFSSGKKPAGGGEEMAYTLAQKCMKVLQIRLGGRVNVLCRKKKTLEAKRADVEYEYERIRRYDSVGVE